MLVEGFDNLVQVFDVDVILWMLVFNNVLVNLSFYIGQYVNNYYFYQDVNGKIMFILGNFNLVFGSFKNIGVVFFDLSILELFILSLDFYKNSEECFFIVVLFNNEVYYKQYFLYMCLIFVDWVLSGKLENCVRVL